MVNLLLSFQGALREGIPVALASSGNHDKIEFNLREAGLWPLFEGTLLCSLFLMGCRNPLSFSFQVPSPALCHVRLPCGFWV